MPAAALSPSSLTPHHAQWTRPSARTVAQETLAIRTVTDTQETGRTWTPLLEPGLTLVAGDRNVLRAFHHEIAHHTVHHSEGHVLWCDAVHGFDPYWFAELNLVNGHEADAGADRLLVKRCMTPFQWDSVLTQHLDEKLLTVDAGLVIAAPYDALFSTDELTDWEQEDYVRYSLRHLRTLTRRHQIPLLVSVDMNRWWRTHPTLAQMAFEGVRTRWTITNPDGRLRAERQDDHTLLDPYLHRQVTLLDFLDEIPSEG